jgi:Asp-tRNA(Asn)/Glu-tRNA(Gln) amidotransferase A subunit family amidase
MPVGLQLIGAPLDEATLLRTADAFERIAPQHGCDPPEET